MAPAVVYWLTLFRFLISISNFATELRASVLLYLVISSKESISIHKPPRISGFEMFRRWEHLLLHTIKHTCANYLMHFENEFSKDLMKLTLYKVLKIFLLKSGFPKYTSSLIFFKLTPCEILKSQKKPLWFKLTRCTSVIWKIWYLY